MKKWLKIVEIGLISVLLLTGCGKGNDQKQDVKTESSQAKVEAEGAMPAETATTAAAVDSEVKAELTSAEKIAKIDLSKKPNELGQVMVLMYHHIGPEEGEWTRTPENFKSDLETLYKEGYRPIRLIDYVNNNINVEAGFTPIVITFDDGRQNNFNYIEKADGTKEMDPNCAVAIMDAFKKEHPDFGLTATFFVYGKVPFEQEAYISEKFNYLVKNGYDIGNHTLDHNDFKSPNSQNAEKIQMYVGKNKNFIESMITEFPDYQVNTMALPYGHRPKDKNLEKYLYAGSYDGMTYENLAVLNVGWDPDKSPVSAKFDPQQIHRIRAGVIKVDNVGILDWLESFRKHPERRYISDGYPDIVTIKKADEGLVSPKALEGKELNVYEENK